MVLMMGRNIKGGKKKLFFDSPVRIVKINDHRIKEKIVEV